MAGDTPDPVEPCRVSRSCGVPAADRTRPDAASTPSGLYRGLGQSPGGRVARACGARWGDAVPASCTTVIWRFLPDYGDVSPRGLAERGGRSRPDKPHHRNLAFSFRFRLPDLGGRRNGTYSWLNPLVDHAQERPWAREASASHSGRSGSSAFPGFACVLAERPWDREASVSLLANSVSGLRSLRKVPSPFPGKSLEIHPRSGIM